MTAVVAINFSPGKGQILKLISLLDIFCPPPNLGFIFVRQRILREKGPSGFSRGRGRFFKGKTGKNPYSLAFKIKLHSTF